MNELKILVVALFLLACLVAVIAPDKFYRLVMGGNRFLNWANAVKIEIVFRRAPSGVMFGILDHGRTRLVEYEGEGAYLDGCLQLRRRAAVAVGYWGRSVALGFWLWRLVVRVRWPLEEH